MSRQQKFEAVTEELRRISADGKAITGRLWDQEKRRGLPSRSALIQLFGCSIRDLAHHAGLDAGKGPFSKPDLIERRFLDDAEKKQWAINQLKRISPNGYPITMEEFDEYRQRPGLAAAKLSLMFGWPNLNKCAGLVRKRPKEFVPACDSQRERASDSFSEKQILDAIRSLSSDGYGPGVKEWDQHRPSGYPAATKVRGLFNRLSWHDILAKAGLRTQADKQRDEREAQWVMPETKSSRSAEELKPLQLVHDPKPKPYSYYCTTRKQMITTLCYSSARFEN